EPSIIGISILSSSIKQLSTPDPRNADRRCSQVDSTTPRRISVVAYEQCEMYSTDAGISKLSRSVRTNIYPVFCGAVLSVRVTGAPVCRPVPDVDMLREIVVWFI